MEYRNTLFPERIKIPKEELKFSILIPSRYRENQLSLLLESIICLTKNPLDIEILIGIDNDDIESPKAIGKFLSLYSDINLIIFKHPRGNSLVYHYINKLAYSARGKYIITTNNDSMFGSKDWDINCFNRLEQYLSDKPDGICLGITNSMDKTQSRLSYPYLIADFPLLSKKTVDLMGFFLDPYYVFHTADWDICDLYHKLNRVVDLRDDLIIHHRPSLQDIELYKKQYIIRTDDTSKIIQAPAIERQFDNGGWDTRLPILEEYIDPSLKEKRAKEKEEALETK